MDPNSMNGIYFWIGIGGVAAALISAVASVVNNLLQRRQIQIMAKQEAQQILLNVSRELDTDRADGSPVEQAMRNLVNRRIADVRTQLRGEFERRFAGLEGQLTERHITNLDETMRNLSRIVRDQEVIAAIAREAESLQRQAQESAERLLAYYSRAQTDIALHGKEIQSLQEQLVALRSGEGYGTVLQLLIQALANQFRALADQNRQTGGGHAS